MVYVSLDSSVFWSAILVSSAILYHSCIVSRAVKSLKPETKAH